MIVRTENDMSYVRHNFTPVKNKLLNKFSNAEDHFEFMLKQTDLFYVREKGNFRYGTRWCYYDFFLPYYRLYIEIDGVSHNRQEQKIIDADKEEIIKWKKRFIVRLTNEEVLSLNEISLSYLVGRLCEQFSKKSEWNFHFTVTDYLENLIKNIKQAAEDMLGDTGIGVDMNKTVYAYNKNSNRIYMFKNACIAKMNLQLGLVQIMNLLERTTYNYRTNSRKHVLSYSLEDCIKKIKSSTGVENPIIGSEQEIFPIKDLLPIMSEKESEVWYYTAKKKLDGVVQRLLEIGFERRNDSELGCVVFYNSSYLFYYRKKYRPLNISVYSFVNHIKCVWNVGLKLYEKEISCKKLSYNSIESVLRGFITSIIDKKHINIKEIAPVKKSY